MALQMPFTADDGTYHPSAYWRPGSITLNLVGRSARATFLAWRDATARAEELSPIPGGVKEYGISGDAFDALYAAHVAPGGPNIAEQVYAHAKATRDILAPTEADPDRVVGFFDGAIDV